MLAQEPCPWRIVDDCGGTFIMGVTCDKVFQAVKGFCNDPLRGCNLCLSLQFFVFDFVFVVGFFNI
uniref:Uncharacterized protein n=1 Tax=Moschus moschiferus TaxID=68415 RepID=A0A8C6DWB6_MOSMO